MKKEQYRLVIQFMFLDEKTYEKIKLKLGAQLLFQFPFIFSTFSYAKMCMELPTDIFHFAITQNSCKQLQKQNWSSCGPICHQSRVLIIHPSYSERMLFNLHASYKHAIFSIFINGVILKYSWINM